MKLKMTLENQFQAFLPPFCIHGLALFVFFLIKNHIADEAPVLFKVFFIIIISFSFLCVFIVHINYYLYERKRTYFFAEDYFIITLKGQEFRYSFNEINHINFVEAGYEMYDYRRFSTRRFSFFFPSYSFVEIVLTNGNCIPISCFVHSNLEILLKRLIPEKDIIPDLKAIPII